MTPLSIPTAPAQNRRAGFTITELLVVIGIIVLLAGLLLVAMGRVRASSLKTSTVSTMQSFARACDAFQTEHGQYPGVIPETVLARAIANDDVEVIATNDDNVTIGETSFSSTENALLHLMGGFRVCPPNTPGCGGPSGDSPTGTDYTDFDATYELRIGTGVNSWLLKVNINRIGEGPVINGRPYPAYFTPGPGEVAVVEGQWSPGSQLRIPDLLDAWGHPILYTRRLRNTGPLVGPADPPGSPPPPPQFVIEGFYPYLQSTGLGERYINQEQQSILWLTGTNLSQDNNRYATFAQLIRHPALGRWDLSPLDNDNRGRVAPRGEYVLISAGPDGIFFSQFEGPGTPGSPVTDLITVAEGNNNPQAVSSYDDIVVFGGG